MLLILSNEIKGNHGAHMKAEFLEKQTNIYIEKKSVSYMDLARF
jgi:phage terminase large subunit-like protein